MLPVAVTLPDSMLSVVCAIVLLGQVLSHLALDLELAGSPDHALGSAAATYRLVGDCVELLGMRFHWRLRAVCGSGAGRRFLVA